MIENHQTAADRPDLLLHRFKHGLVHALGLVVRFGRRTTAAASMQTITRATGHE